MSKIRFSNEQIKELLKNKNVDKCNSKSITYNKNFKILAIEKYYNGYSPKMIFQESGFNLNVVGITNPKDCLKRWRKIYSSKGKQGLLLDNRGKSGLGGRPKKKNWNKENNIKYLRNRIAYLEEENSFLKRTHIFKRE